MLKFRKIKQARLQLPQKIHPVTIFCPLTWNWNKVTAKCRLKTNIFHQHRHSGRARKFKKVQSRKNSWNHINQFHEKIFGPNSIFCNFKNGQKSIFELGRSLKRIKMQFHETKIGYIWFHEIFLPGIFLKFSGPL